jgi:outer membrane autotransporter protein
VFGFPGDKMGSSSAALCATWFNHGIYLNEAFTSATFFGPSEGHDRAIISAGLSVQITPAITAYINYDGQLGRGNYDPNAVTGTVRISF